MHEPIHLRLMRSRPALADAALALLLAIGALVEMMLSDLDAPVGARILAVLTPTLPLAWRSIAPVPTVALTSGGLALAALLGLPIDEALIPLLGPFVALYSVGVHSALPGVIAGAAIFLAASGVVFVADSGALQPTQIAGLVAALAVGRAVRIMGFESETLVARTAILERERDEKARIAVAEERARIARELHDIIGHSISVMGLQAGAVRRLLRPDQEKEREALLAVERTGRDAIDEMRRLLSVLREGGEEPAMNPLPTLALVDELVADLRRAGLQIEMGVDGALDDVSPGRALAAYRVLQESLTNVLKHAPDAHVRVSIVRTPAELRIAVLDDGRPPVGQGSGAGYGLVGMRERVALYGGTLEAGPARGGGFSVVACLPIAGQ